MLIKTLVVDEDVNHTTEVMQSLSSSSSINVVSASSKQTALENIEESDVIIVNMLLNGNDSYDLIKTIRNDYEDKIIIATSEFISANMMASISEYQIDYFIRKPFEVGILEEIIKALYTKYTRFNEKPQTNIKVEITNLLHLLGVPSHIKGYNYIRDSIELIYENAELASSITKELYPKVASSYQTTSSRVERAIRHAIEVSWMRGDYNLMEEIFGNSIDFDRSKPTNSEFIVTLADRLKLKQNIA